MLTCLAAQERQATLAVTRFLHCTTSIPSTIIQHLCDQVYPLVSSRKVQSLTSKSEEKAKPVKDAFPKIKIALGGLDDSELLEKEAAKADVVIRTLPRHTRQ
jgi:hypothetical protein